MKLKKPKNYKGANVAAAVWLVAIALWIIIYIIA